MESEVIDLCISSASHNVLRESMVSKYEEHETECSFSNLRVGKLVSELLQSRL